MWIERDISKKIDLDVNFIQVLIGPRQVGKTSVFEKISCGYEFISLDDLSARELAQTDPKLFLKQFGEKKLIVDEAQYAPNLFPNLKLEVDKFKRRNQKKENLYRLTGSNQILIDRAVKEGLTGRASYYELNTLSVSEILNEIRLPVSEILFQGGWPEFYAYPETDRLEYLNDYLRSYVEKDIVLTAGIQKSSEFLRFIALLAGRTGQLLNSSEISKKVNVTAATVTEWVSILERMKVISLAPPYFSNLSKRLVKSPKVFFLDTGLACRLQGWSEAQPMMVSPQLGSLFETLVFGEISKFISNRKKSWKIHHWRTRDGEEIDFIIELENHRFLAIESKVSQQVNWRNQKSPEFDKVFKETEVLKKIVCHMEGDQILRDQVPIRFLSKFLSEF